MVQQRDPREPDVRQTKELAGEILAATATSRKTTFCAYNQPRERFVSAVVELADSETSIEAGLAAVTPGSGAALWIVPAQAISPASVRHPIDLVYLGQDQVVLETIESFPFSGPSYPISLTASVLVLPAGTIVSATILSGDRLIVCPPEEKRLSFANWGRPETETQATQKGSLTADVDSSDLSGGAASSDLLTPSDRLASASQTEKDPAFGASDRGIEHNVPKSSRRPKRNWLARLFWGDSPEPRKASRESLSWLIVYFFTGGAPVAHEVQDVSSTGLYVLTQERWYPGTVVRITLTDRRNPSIDRSLTLNARVVRSGKDGVGLEFLLHNKEAGDPCVVATSDNDLMDVSRVQIDRFLQRLRSSAP